ncbi:MAG: hypothetical protein MI924_39510 [Chloroflexales bacterium]|nr:hypothetical protein [Chloroflexales bacterium]
MAPSSVTLRTQSYAGQPAADTAPSEGAACRLNSLEQPRFFHGQLLTDQDLTALLNWAQDKMRLVRYRHGWGVVCGLEVRCDPQHEGHIIVGPGYAVSDCGDDIILSCESDPYDLSKVCFEHEAVCADLYKQAGQEAEDQEPYVEVDLYIRYAEQGASPQTALGRRVCGQTEICEYSRTRETYELHHAVFQGYGSGGYSDPLDRAAKLWHNQFDAIWSDLRQLMDASNRWEQMKQSIDKKDKERSLRSFCFVYDHIEQARKQEEGLTDANFYRFLFWVVQDRHNAFLARQCVDGQACLGVPLARVRMRATSDDAGKQRCTVFDIDPFPPYRRPISPASWPAPLGSVNLGQLIWHRWEEVRSFLIDLGIEAATTIHSIPSTRAELENLFRCPATYPLFAAAGDTVAVQVVDAGLLGQRVVGFCLVSQEYEHETAAANGPESVAPADAPPSAEPDTAAEPSAKPAAETESKAPAPRSRKRK